MDGAGFFYVPMAFLVDRYWLTVGLAVVFLAVAFIAKSGGWAMKAAAISWTAYAGWEGFVQYATPDANIRVDLLLIWPVLLVLSLLAAIGFFRGGMRNG